MAGDGTLPVNRDRIVDQGLDPGCRQLLAHRLPGRTQHRKQMVDVTGIVLRRDVHRSGVVQRRSVFAAEGTAPLGPAGQQLEPRAQHGRLHLVEARIDPDFVVSVAIGLAAVSDPLGSLRETGIVRRQRAAVAERRQVLGRIEAVSGRRAERTHRAPLTGREVRLAAVLDDGEAVARGHAHDGRHVRGLSVKVYGHDGRGARGDRGSGGGRIECEAARVDVGEHRSRPSRDDRQRRVGGRQRGRNHLGTRADVERAKRDGERVGSRADANGTRGSGCTAEFVLERLELRSEDEPATRHNPPNRCVDRWRVLFERQLEKSNHPITSSGAGSSR